MKLRFALLLAVGSLAAQDRPLASLPYTPSLEPAFIDRSVRNSFSYYYAVTAFDVNSLKSGPSSLESARITKSTTPRAPSPNQTDAVLVSSLTGDDGKALDPLASWSISPSCRRSRSTWAS